MEIKFVNKEGKELFRENADGTVTYFDEQLKNQAQKIEEKSTDDREDAGN